MSTPGPYRSNSLNLVVQQFRRLRDDLQRAMRQGSIAAVWTLQVALYPFYIAFQTTRLMGRQLRQAAKQAMPRLQAVAQTVQESTQPTQPQISLTADTPIKNTLRSLPKDLDAISIALPSQDQSSGETTPQSKAIAPTTSPAPETFAIRGFASLISTGNLVLVTEKNQILDRLSPEQQGQLQQIMRRELALYHRERQRLAPRMRSLPAETQRVLPLPEIHQHQWLPVQWIRHVMTWMQLSDVAIAANLFREMQLVATPLPTHIHLDAHTERRIQDARQAWFMSHLSPLPLDESEHQERLSAQASLTVSQKQLPASPMLTVKPFEIPIPSVLTQLINWSRKSQLTHDNSALDAEIELQLLDDQAPFSINQWPAPAFFALNWQPSTSSESPDPQTMSLQVQAGDRLQSDLSSEESTNPEVEPNSDNIDLVTWHWENESLNAQTDATWVDTEAIVVSYIKHPLEQVLEWVDIGMLWLESRLISVWHWLKPTQNKD